VPAAQLDDLAQAPGVLFVEPDLPAAPTAKPGPDARSAIVTRYPAIDRADELWNRGLTGAGIGIAVIDSGTDDAADFDDRLDVTILDAQSRSGNKDRIGHGTLVASIAAGASTDGRFTGIAPGADVYSINVQRKDGIYTSDVLAGLEWILDSRAAGGNVEVVVLALSEIVPSSYRASALDAMLERVWHAGVTVVVSGGNTGPGTAQFAPANDPFVISVGALDDAGTIATADDAETSWTTSGTTQDGFEKPELLAPGRLVAGLLPLKTELGAAAPAENWVAPGYAAATGTSFSAPQVAGAVALIAQAHPEWTPDQLKWVLVHTARRVDGGSAPALDVAAAVDFDGTPGNANDGIPPSDYAAGLSSTDAFHAARETQAWSANSWTGTQWTGNSWNANSWAAGSWTANSWAANSWAGASWL
jgi:serine protease AprX